MGRAGERLGGAGKHPGEDNTNVSFDVCPCRVRTRSSGCVVQSPDSWKGAETCSCRREEAGLCPWWHGHTDKVPQGIHHPPSLSHRIFPALAPHPSLWVVLLCGHLLPAAGLGACVGGRASPAQPLFLPRPWQTPERGCLCTLVWDTDGAWLGPGTGGLQKKEGWWGWTLRSAMGTLVGHVSPPQTHPVLCSVR